MLKRKTLKTRRLWGIHGHDDLQSVYLFQSCKPVNTRLRGRLLTFVKPPARLNFEGLICQIVVSQPGLVCQRM